MCYRLLYLHHSSIAKLREQIIPLRILIFFFCIFFSLFFFSNCYLSSLIAAGNHINRSDVSRYSGFFFLRSSLLQLFADIQGSHTSSIALMGQTITKSFTRSRFIRSLPVIMEVSIQGRGTANRLRICIESRKGSIIKGWP